MSKRYRNNGLCPCGWQLRPRSDGGFFCDWCLAQYPPIPTAKEDSMKPVPEEPCEPPKRVEKATGHPEFYRVIEEMKALHEKKAADYGLGKDMLANVRASTEFGVPAWLGVAIRMNDKMTRLKSFAVKGCLANESLEDSLIDIANYAILSLILYREASKS